MALYIDAFPGREISVNGKKHLYFGGTSYLGLQTDTEFQNILIDNIRKYGTNYGASRKSNVRISVYGQGEDHLANLVGSEDCITLSSGYLAAQLLCNHFSTASHKLFYAPNTHVSLYQSQIKPYATFESLNNAVREHLSINKTTIPVVLLDSIDFSGANYPDFNGLKSLPLQDIIVVVDDSHGMGVVGSNGGGVFRILADLTPKELLVCCSLGKGYGIQAGALFGTRDRIAQLKNTSFFGGASPASPANIATLLQAESVYSDKRQLLKGTIDRFSSLVNHHLDHFYYMEYHPAFSFSNKKLADALENNQIVITNFNYPTEKASIMSRIVLSAHHTKKDIERVGNLINTLLK